MNDLPIEILSHMLSFCGFMEALVRARRVSVKFKRAVAAVLPVEQVPQLLHSSNYEPLDPETLNQLFPSLSSMGSYACVAGKMKDEVWQSKLVQFLAHSDDLDSIPWKEMIFHRVGSGRDRVLADDNKSFEQEFVTDPKSGKQSWVLPGTDKAPFRLTTWMNTNMYSFNSGYDPLCDNSDIISQFGVDCENLLKSVASRLSIPTARNEVRFWDLHIPKVFGTNKPLRRPGTYYGDWVIAHVEIGPFFIVTFLWDGT